jgi:hypothetical protein
MNSNEKTNGVWQQDQENKTIAMRGARFTRSAYYNVVIGMEVVVVAL